MLSQIKSGLIKLPWIANVRKLQKAEMRIDELEAQIDLMKEHMAEILQDRDRSNAKDM